MNPPKQLQQDSQYNSMDLDGDGVVTDVIGAAEADDITLLQRPQGVKLEQFRNLVEVDVQVVNLVAESISLGCEAIMLHMADVDGTLEFCISRHR